MGKATKQRMALHEHAKQPASAPDVDLTEQFSDIAVASAIARTVRRVPGVVDLSPGLVTQSATYGIGERVSGVVIHHLAQHKVVLEIHVLLSEAYCKATACDAGRRGAAHECGALNVLDAIAAHIREAVNASAAAMPLPMVVRADVLIDDLV